MSAVFDVRPGTSLPAGARAKPGGVNFSLFSRHATRVWLQIYATEDAVEPIQVIELDPDAHRTFFFWHVFVAGATPGLYYTWRADGPKDTRNSGSRFDPRLELLDPWAREVSAARWNRRAAERGRSPGMRARIVSAEAYDWEGDSPLQRPIQNSVIYELHVGGFTRHPSAQVSDPGTFRGLIEKIPYLQELGITDVELMPVMAFDAQDAPKSVSQRGLENYWGYSTCGFFAPHSAYGAAGGAGEEFRDMVKALHKAGIGVIIDVAFNHTAEGDDSGPVINFKGLANEIFYHLDPADRRHYRDFTGCGNTVNCNHPLVSRFILDCMEYWVREMHVDGFRLDLASVLARGEDGEPMYHAPVLWSIEFSSWLSRSYLIAEAWDASGLYQVGDFPGYRWAEWNGDYRDIVRRFIAGESGLTGALATRIAGSSDLYADDGRLPINSINFVTCHDGFTLNDLVTYEQKHNRVNGESNRDGIDTNYSFNCGREGPTDDEAINSLRRRQMRNCLTILMLSQGVPMILAGDEMHRTQHGNNNAWCQNNETSWIDWTLVDRHFDMVRFMREVIALRRRHASLHRDRFLTGRPAAGTGSLPDITWHGQRLGLPEFDDPENRVLVFTLAGLSEDEPAIHAILNGSDEPLTFELPQIDGRTWRLAIDTARPAPADITPPEDQRAWPAREVEAAARSVLVFEAPASEEPRGPA